MHRSVTVGTTATRLDTTADTTAAPGNLKSYGESICVSNNGATKVWIGTDNTVTAGDAGNAGGWVAAGERWSLDLNAYDQLWGITESGSSNVRVLETGL